MNLIFTIITLSCYVLTWVLILVVPMLGFESEQSDLYVSYLLFAEEFLLLACIAVAGLEFARDMKKKLTDESNKK